jgi:putative ATPase
MEPLAAKIRPKNLKEFIGQEHLVGPGKPIREAIEKRHLFSFILWGPPGVGKTTLAKIYANAIGADFVELSAVSAGKEDIRKIVGERAGEGERVRLGQAARSALFPASASEPNKPTILFLDEIHRFNKTQQDFLLPFVETGRITLVGATTENPSFEVISPLLSRCRVFVLNELSSEELSKIIDRTGIAMDKAAREWVINFANGDARQLLGLLEATQALYKEVNIQTLTDALQSKYIRYDKKGDEHYDTISAFIKSMRASQPDAALYYLARMVEAGEDPKFIARRMVIFASEDVGLADPMALEVANNVFRAVEVIGLPECAINLAHGVCYLAGAPKTKRSYEAYFRAVEDVKAYGNLPIPLQIRNPVTKLMKDLNYGKGYERYPKNDLLPEKLKGKKYLI